MTVILVLFTMSAFLVADYAKTRYERRNLQRAYRLQCKAPVFTSGFAALGALAQDGGETIEDKAAQAARCGVAQLAEQQAVNLPVAGSTPAPTAKVSAV